MHKKGLAYKLLSFFSLLNLSLQPFFNFLLISAPAFVLAQEQIEAGITFDKGKNSFNLTVNKPGEIRYELFYRTDSQIENVSGTSKNDGGNFSQEIYAGTCSSGGACTPHQVLRGILKIEVKNEGWLTGQKFTIDNGELNLVAESATCSLNLTDEENSWLENPEQQKIEKECLTNQSLLDTKDEDWQVDKEKETAETKEKVKLGVKYVFPLENKVSVSFKCLPKEGATPLKIQKVKISALNLPEGINPYGEYAYDITTGMQDGTFEYEITLPKPENATAEVSYIEKSVEDATKNEIKTDEVKAVEEEKLAQEGDKVKVEGLDHFTIFLTEVTEKDISQKSPSPTTLSLPSLSYNPSDDYALSLVSGIWTSVTGGENISGVNTNEVRWGRPTGGSNKSGLRFDGTGQQSFDEGNNFLLGALTHFNYPVTDAATGAKLKITLTFSKPAVSPNPDFSYDFVIDETPNSCWPSYPSCCPYGDSTGNGCDDKITFPTSYGEKSFQIGDKLYTLKIQGFVNSWPGGSPVSYFITGEKKDNTAYLIGTLSSVLVAAPQISLVEKAVNGDDADSAPGPTLYVGDTATFTYSIQNTGNVTLTSIVVKDDNGTPGNTSDDFTVCSGISLNPGDQTTCTKTKSVVAGQYTNTAYATGKYIDTAYTSNNESANYFGASKGTIVIVKDAVPNNSQDFGFTGELGQFDLDDDSGDSTLSNTKTFSNITPGTYTITEPNVPGWDLTKVTCNDGNSQGNVNNRNAVIQLDSGETVTCTFTNIQQKGHLVVQKTTIPSGDPTSFAIEATGSGTITGGGAGTITDSTDKNYEVTPGTYSATETVPTGWVQTGNTCTNVAVGAADTKYCTITNTKYGSITIVKDAQPNSSQSFGFTTTGTGLTDFALSDDGLIYHNETKTFTNLLPGDYTVTEGSNSDWALTGLSCNDGDSTVDVADRKASIKLAAGENVTCTFTNTMYGSITVQKNVDLNGDGDFSDTGETNATDWTWKLNSEGHSTNTTVGNLLPATYTVSETQKDGYHVNNMSCRVTSGGATTTDYGAVTSGNVVLAAGQTLVCTFTNTRDTGTIELKKVWSGTGGQTNLNIGTTARGSEIVTVQTGASGGTPLSTGQQTVPVGTYYLSESGGLDNYTKSSLSCFNDTDNDGLQDTEESSITAGANDSVNVAKGDHIICSYTNTRQQGTIIVKKVMVGGTGEFTFTGTPSGTINTNEGTLSTTVDTGQYTTTENVLLPEWELTSISCNDGSSTIPSTWNLSTRTAIFNVENGETVTCTFTNTKYGSISGHKYEDSDGKDSTTSDRSLLSGWVMNLWQWVTDKFVDTGKTATTDSNGYYIFSNLLPDLYQVRETSQTGWVNLLSPNDITLDAGESDQNNNFINYRVGSITIVKDSNPDSSQGFGFTGPDGYFTLYGVTNDAAYPNTKTFSNLLAGSYTVREWPDESFGIWTLTSLRCEDPTENSFASTTDPYQANINLAAGENVTCTFANELKGKIIVKKETLPDGSTQSFDFTASYDSDGFSLTDGGENDSGYIRAGNYSVSETTPTGWSLTNTSCVSSLGDTETASNLELDAGETITCTFTNTRDTGYIRVEKLVYPSSDTSTFHFDLTAEDGNDYDAGGYSLGNGNWGSYTVPTQDYTLTETTNSDFITSYQCVDLPTHPYSGTVDYSNPTEGNSVNFTLQKDHEYWCRFINTKKGAIIVKKDMVGGTDTFNFTGGLNGSISTDLGTIQTSVIPGTYTSIEGAKTGWDLTSIVCDDGNSSGDVSTRTATFSVEAGETVTCTFTNTKYGSIQGKKYEDLNGNGSWNSGESFLNGWTISLFDSQWNPRGQMNTGGTGTTGQYKFENLLPGTYYLCEDLKSGWKQTEPSSGEIKNNSYCREETVSAGDTLTAKHFGNFELTYIQGRKYNDLNANGAQDAGEPEINGWTIRLYDSSWKQVGLDQQTHYLESDGDGRYKFENLFKGTYYICEVLPEGWTQTDPAGSEGFANQSPNKLTEGPRCRKADITTSGTPVTGKIFGNVNYGSVTVVKFNDTNQNGVYNDTESVLDGWDITLGTTTKTTDDNGLATFNNLLAGSYDLSETIPADSDWMQTGIYCDGGTFSDGKVTVAAGANIDCYIGNTQYGSVEVYKFEDLDGDGEKNSGEPPLPGWEILLSGQTATTSAQGKATFTNLVAGEYNLSENLKDGWQQTGIYCTSDEAQAEPTPTPTLTPTPTTPPLVDRILGVNPVFAQIANNNSHQVSVNPGEVTTCYIGNFKLGSISGAKIYDRNDNGTDRNDNGTKESGEGGIEGWKIFLSGGSLKKEISTLTDSKGYYEFTGLAAGDYIVREEKRDGWRASKPESGKSGSITISSGTEAKFDFFNAPPVSILLTKSNNATTPVKPGDLVEYTLTITVDERTLSEMTLIDVLPDGFSYQTNTSKITTTLGDSTATVNSEPTLKRANKKLVWTWPAGIAGGSVVVVKYTVKIDATNKPSSYTNFAFVWGSGSPTVVESQIVDSVVKIEPAYAPEGKVAGGEVLSAATQTTGQIEGEVLGATLPAAGANTWFLLAAIALIGAGLALRPKKKENRQKN